MSRFIKTIKLFREAYGAYKLQVLFLAGMGFLSGILEGLGVNTLIPLFSLITNDATTGDDTISRAIRGAFSYFNVDFSLKYLLILIATLFVAKAIVLFIVMYLQITITTEYERRTRIDLFRKTLNAQWGYLLQQKIGYLEKILITEVRYSARLFRQASSLIIMLSGLMVYVAVAFNISFPITVITLAFGTVILLALRPFVVRTKRLAGQTVNANKQSAHFINENILGIKAIKAAAIGNKVADIGDKYFQLLKKLYVDIFLIKSVPVNLFQPISIIFILVVFAFAYQTPGFHLASFLAVMYLVHRIFSYTQQLQSSIQTITEAVPYLESMLEYKKSVIGNKEESGGRDSFSFKNELRFHDVSFSYDAIHVVLSGVDFSLRRGGMVGLIGSSGSGKTTIVDLLLRLFNPVNGTIFLDGKDIKKINIDSWREKIGYVSQDMFLLNDTVANNIKFYDSFVTDADVRNAACTAFIDETVGRLPNGFNTIIGERGVILSAGQRQRIIIARVLARKPEILILDEATSALDNESEAHIQKAIENLKGKISVLVIAHRLGTVMNCDSIFVLEEGRIIEKGAPRVLLENKESYFYKSHNIRS